LETFFCDVLLPVAVDGKFTYRVMQEHNEYIEVGRRVLVPFGKQKVITGIIFSIHQTPPKEYEAKYILDILDSQAIVLSSQLKLFEWVANYYLCTEGEVLKAALPSGLKLSSESIIQLNPDIEITDITLTEKEGYIVNALKQEDTLDYQQVSQLLGVKNVYKIIRSLANRHIILILEKINEKYKPKLVKKIRLSRQYTTEESLNQLFEALGKKQKQIDVLLNYLKLCKLEVNDKGILKTVLQKENISKSSLLTLVKNNVFEEFEVPISRLESYVQEDKNIKLSEEQTQAKEKIIASFEAEKTALLHGITGSGKTAIYISLIQEVISSGQTVLLMLPEIALTTQIVKRLRVHFGSKMAVYHSRFSDNERVEVWQGIVENKFDVIVGVRSSIFLPFSQLGLIIVDEEHDSSYKQYDPNPRYNARDTALVLGQMHHAKVLLGSATPSTESYFLSKIQNKWSYIPLMQRYGNAVLPKIELTKTHYFGKGNQYSKVLLSHIQNRLDKSEQIILFQNRRGYSPFLMCNHCQHIPKCVRCSVSLTYHQYHQELRCHYCGYKQDVPRKCSSCGSHEVHTVGQGTEKIEDDIKLRFPEAKISRMDLDTTRKKHSYEEIIQDFEEQKVNVLVGTQMVTKGLDFDNVSLVGVLGVDHMLFHPDFRSRERTFQLLTQVSGRAGRKEKAGKVIIQTNDPKLSLFSMVIKHDFNSFYQTELTERKTFHYPPFFRIIRLTVKNKDKGIGAYSAQQLAKELKKVYPERFVLGPEEPLIGKIRNYYLNEILLKIRRNDARTVSYKKAIKQSIEKVKKIKKLASSQIVIDVDPM